MLQVIHRFLGLVSYFVVLNCEHHFANAVLLLLLLKEPLNAATILVLGHACLTSWQTRCQNDALRLILC